VTLFLEAGDELPATLQKVAPVAGRALGRDMTVRQLADARKRMLAGRVPGDIRQEYDRHLRVVHLAADLTKRQKADRAFSALKQKAKAQKVH
jgi:hypothetical protein